MVSKGQLTFDAEGTEGGTFHSRKPHVPSDSSGVTVGRGYDLKHRKKQDVIDDMTAAGISESVAIAYAAGVGLSGQGARTFISNNNLGEITTAQQKKLFEITYTQIEKDVIRICSKADVVEAYGATNWQSLNQKIKDLLVDLRFRGDYTPTSRKFLQKHVANNDLTKCMAEISIKANWPSVPPDRFKRRKEYLQ